MRTHLALLRGINLGGKNRVGMVDLRQLVESLGHGEVTTYIQSGNVAFSAAGGAVAGAEALASELEEAIAARLGVRCAVVVLGGDELGRVVDANPFGAAAAADPRSVHAVFLPALVDEARASAVSAALERARAKGSRDDARAAGRAIYLWTPGGFGRSDLVSELSRGGSAAPSADGTARNWATVTALAALLA